MKMRNIVFAPILALILSTAPTWASEDCTFSKREEIKEILSQFPPEVIGWASCSDKYPAVGIFIMARFAKLEDLTFDSFLLSHAKIVVYDGVSSKILRQSRKSDGLRTAIVETKRPNDFDSTMHYAFTVKANDGSTILYNHTLSASETQKNRETLEALRLVLTGPKFLKQLEAP